MVENLSIQKVLAPTLTSRVKKADRDKNKNRERSFEEELKEKKEKKKGLFVDKEKADEKTILKKKGSLKEKHEENTESTESRAGKLIDLHI